MEFKSKFAIMEHNAKRAGLHYDLRFIMPNSKMWASFAVRKGVPTEIGKRVLAIRTHDHTEKEAMMLGKIESGYGAGVLKLWDKGSCIIMKYHPSHITINFNGNKIKGIYHFINIAINKSVSGKDFKNQQYWLFKGRPVNEIKFVDTGELYDDDDDSLNQPVKDYLKKIQTGG